jgi:hypothetical protein
MYLQSLMVNVLKKEWKIELFFEFVAEIFGDGYSLDSIKDTY